ncbi:MAG: D-alanyl-D-alanine carboxypeptidase [Faecalibacterium sp.]|jgi:D-alanyl-D-alanine carboxypeptidase (penicillin-binding protein 5/6)|nr:D-alanyl-D-alanine carboxypeptidase [Faecalibacterium sp.]
MAKKWISMAAACALLFFCAMPAAAATGPWVPSEAYLVMDAETGQVLLAKNADEELDPASVTKIMTLGLACQKANGDWTAQLTVTHDDVHTLYGTDSSHIALAEGEIVTLEEMLYATAMASANDAANVLAEYIGGSIEGGVAAMNAEAEVLGLAHTHFMNPHGISEDGHYTSAGDLAVILQWAMQQPGFAQIFTDTNMYTMPGTNVHPEVRYFSVQDHMRRQSSMYYVPEITGSKIGYTDVARYTYACTAEKDGVKLICTVMKSDLKTDKYADVKTLIDYSFAHFRSVTVTPGGSVNVTVQGGGEALGTLQAAAPAVTVLLDTSLDESAVSFAAQDVSYTLGDEMPQAAFSISGQGAQEDVTVTADLALDGLADLLAGAPTDDLPAAKVEAKILAEEKGLRVPIWLLIPAVAACVAFLVLRMRRVKATEHRKRLRNNAK